MARAARGAPRVARRTTGSRSSTGHIAVRLVPAARRRTPRPPAQRAAVGAPRQGAAGDPSGRYSPRNTESSTRLHSWSASAALAPRSGPSSSSSARPCTADQATSSLLARRSGGRTPASATSALPRRVRFARRDAELPGPYRRRAAPAARGPAVAVAPGRLPVVTHRVPTAPATGRAGQLLRPRPAVGPTAGAGGGLGPGDEFPGRGASAPGVGDAQTGVSVTCGFELTSRR